ncbi:MAG: methylenetetrahydrofolate reductase [Chloroflexi bacterium]|nr:methylenetetrahydrofolate reductase [Chloroflexota bacterium]
MSFREAMARGEFPVSLEITPPRASKPAVLLRRARLLEACTVTVNVIQRPERQSSLEAALDLQREGLEPIWHLATGGRPMEEVTADISRAHGAGLGHVLCLRGDHAADTPGTRVTDAIAVVREEAPGMAIGAALDQYRTDERSDRILAGKLRAGARSIWTQPVFELAPLLRSAGFVKAVEPEAHVVAMAMPLLTPESLDAISERLGIPAPEELRRRIEAGEEEAWGAFEETLATLARVDLVDAVAIMTYRADPPPGTAERIVAALQRAGIGEAAGAATDR